MLYNFFLTLQNYCLPYYHEKCCGVKLKKLENCIFFISIFIMRECSLMWGILSFLLKGHVQIPKQVKSSNTYSLFEPTFNLSIVIMSSLFILYWHKTTCLAFICKKIFVFEHPQSKKKSLYFIGEQIHLK